MRMCPPQEGEIGRSSRPHAVGCVLEVCVCVFVWGFISRDFEYLGNLKHKASPFFPLYYVELYIFLSQEFRYFLSSGHILVRDISIMKMLGSPDFLTAVPCL